MLQNLAILPWAGGLEGTPAHVTKAWSINGRPASVAGAPRTLAAPVVTAGTQEVEPGSDTAPQQSQVQSARRHNAQHSGRDKAALFAYMKG